MPWRNLLQTWLNNIRGATLHFFPVWIAPLIESKEWKVSLKNNMQSQINYFYLFICFRFQTDVCDRVIIQFTSTCLRESVILIKVETSNVIWDGVRVWQSLSISRSRIVCLATQRKRERQREYLWNPSMGLPLDQHDVTSWLIIKPRPHRRASPLLLMGQCKFTLVK